jgi:hypothetical protein
MLLIYRHALFPFMAYGFALIFLSKLLGGRPEPTPLRLVHSSHRPTPHRSST